MSSVRFWIFFDGAGEGIRTLDIHLGKVVLYQLSYARNKYSWIIANANMGKQIIWDERRFAIQSFRFAWHASTFG